MDSIMVSVYPEWMVLPSGVGWCRVSQGIVPNRRCWKLYVADDTPDDAPDDAPGNAPGSAPDTALFFSECRHVIPRVGYPLILNSGL